MRVRLGKVTLTPRGVYSSGTTYTRLDLVRDGANAYVSLHDDNVGNAVTDSYYWMQLVDGDYLLTYIEENGLTTGTLTVTGNATIGGTLSVDDDATFGGDMSVTGDLTVLGDIINDALEARFDDIDERIAEAAQSGGSGGSGGTADIANGLSDALWAQLASLYVPIAGWNKVFKLYDSSDVELSITDSNLASNLSYIVSQVDFCSKGGVTALGVGSGGGGSSSSDSLYEPLSTINDTGLGAPPRSGVTLVWDGSEWTYGTTGSGDGSVTSVGLSMPTGFSVTGTPITSSGTFSVSMASGYFIPTTTQRTNWNAAYGWGDHAEAGYATAANLSALTTRVSTLEGYFTSGVANSAVKLKDTHTFWGQQFNGTQDVEGDLTDVEDITMTGQISIGGFVIEYDSTNSALKFNGDIYATGSVTALGAGDSSSSASLSEPLSSINTAGLSAPTDSNVVLLWNGSRWTYSPLTSGGSGDGSVTSVGITNASGELEITGSPITSSGEIDISVADGYVIPSDDMVYAWDTLTGYFTNGSANSALTAGVAETADALTTARTLWGQSFDGRSNVYGTLDSVANINMTGYIVMANNTSVQMADSNGNNKVLMTLNSGNVFSLGYGTRLASYDTRIEGNTINFLTGTGTDAAVIDEDGMLWIKEAEAGVKIGDGLITWDSTNNALKINGDIYATGAVSALGIDSGGGITSIDSLTIGTLNVTGQLNMSDGTRISTPNELYIGNEDDEGIILFSSMASQALDDNTRYWTLSENGHAVFNGSCTSPKFYLSSSNYLYLASDGETLMFVNGHGTWEVALNQA